MPKTKLKTTRVIFISTILMILAISLLALSSIYLLKTTNEHIVNIDNSNNQKLDIIQRMSHIARERSLLMHTMYLESDVWKVDDHYMKFMGLVPRFIRLREKLLELNLKDGEQVLLENALEIIKITEPLQNDIVERIRSSDHSNILYDISQKDSPLEFKLLKVFNQFSKHVRDNTIQERKTARLAFNNTVIVVILISFVIAILITLLMHRSSKKIQRIELELLNTTADLSWDATHDPLTNIFNRRWLSHELTRLKNCPSDSTEINSLVYIDLDDFKPINDNFGHVAGDQCLISFCREIEHHIRQNDVFARIGGDEFAILLEKCSLDKSTNIACSILKNIETLTIQHEDNLITLNCSIGVLEFKSGDINYEHILQTVDALCYKAKKSGKNKIESDRI